ncbi:MAG: GIY-YIG nuclease family protein [Chloroflexota bacterium]|nr:GIY-YIG nuclease family protein [Chloroflexota bacterium]
MDRDREIRGVKSQYYVYILANRTNVALYIGVTSDLNRRIYEHKQKLIRGFAERYGIDKLVYYEVYHDPENAILREKHLKGSSRARKNRLVESLNPRWRDLYDEI